MRVWAVWNITESPGAVKKPSLINQNIFDKIKKPRYNNTQCLSKNKCFCPIKPKILEKIDWLAQDCNAITIPMAKKQYIKRNIIYRSNTNIHLMFTSIFSPNPYKVLILRNSVHVINSVLIILVSQIIICCHYV